MKDNAARNLKETFAVCMSSYADSTDIVEVKNNNGEIKENEKGLLTTKQKHQQGL